MDNLVSNLRGEVGEIITTWTILRYLMAEERRLSSDNVANDLKNQNLIFISILRQKMHDEIVARSSELSTAKIGRLTFHFASAKLNALHTEEDSFRRFIQRERFEEKRNYDISHKELPEQWSDHQFVSIPYRTLLRAVARASVLMKKIDRLALGPSAPYLWREMRKKRYSAMNPPSSMYLLLPHLRLSNEVRAKIVMQEMEEGREVWSEMRTKINSAETPVYVCKKWGAVLLGDRILCLDQYPLQELSQIRFDVPANLAGMPIAARPILEQKDITAKYRAAEVTDDKVVFVPVQRLHLLEKGTMTELCDITVNLAAKLKKDMGQIKVGDVKEFRLTVNVITGYQNLDAAVPPTDSKTP
ncbi:MAG: hypothetical protein ACREQ5_04030 [Candidatus Dormibacteria bacterium]